MSRRQSLPLPRAQARSVATALGWFSLALGATELLAPRTLTRWLGMKGSEPLLRAYGLREIGTGIGILTAREPAGWMWGRVAGDALDMATLLAGVGAIARPPTSPLRARLARHHCRRSPLRQKSQRPCRAGGAAAAPDGAQL